ncbi:MAG: hypothetical protein K6A65_03140 [Succinivibrionaceae bacterium]|nr:hypothetical protein [Succinivibrionaceae bacterium]
MKINLNRLRTLVLPLALVVGSCTYALFHNVEALWPYRAMARGAALSALPWLIFLMLYLAFCKVDPAKMRLRRWHWMVLLAQNLMCLAVALPVHFWPGLPVELELKALVVCIICPTAAAAAVVASRIGGNESSLTTFVILSNLAAATMIPIVFPLIENDLSFSFLEQFTMILAKIFPVIVLPLFLAFLTRYCIKPLHRLILTRLKDASFYVWGFTLTVLAATAVSNIVNSGQGAAKLLILAAVSLACTLGQFRLGRLIGKGEQEPISAGQAYGQKNNMFCIWITVAYISPAVAVAPCCYILWQNVVNAYEIWWKNRKDEEQALKGLPPYHE